MDKTRVLLVDDHAVFRMGTRLLLESDDSFVVIGEADSGQEALVQSRRLRPDLVLMDITLPDMNGLDAMTQIQGIVPGAKVVILTMHEDRDYFFRAIQSGAAGYVVKGSDADHILAALHGVQSGGVYLYPALAKALVTDHFAEQEHGLVRSLSAREVEVLRLIADGLSNKVIASHLGISISTAQTHRTRIMEKLELHTVAELVRYAIRRGIIRP
jgi:two-component system, NarL family, response regulator NreC